jgi:hypothetical protein
MRLVGGSVNHLVRSWRSMQRSLTSSVRTSQFKARPSMRDETTDPLLGACSIHRQGKPPVARGRPSRSDQAFDPAGGCARDESYLPLQRTVPRPDTSLSATSYAIISIAPTVNTIGVPSSPSTRWDHGIVDNCLIVRKIWLAPVGHRGATVIAWPLDLYLFG